MDGVRGWGFSPWESRPSGEQESISSIPLDDGKDDPSPNGISLKGALLGILALTAGYFEKLGSNEVTATAVDKFSDLRDLPTGDMPAWENEIPEFEHYDSFEGYGDESSCVDGLLVGVAGSVVARDLTPLLLGAAGCFAGVGAQQPIGDQFQINDYQPDYQEQASVASFNDGGFVVVWESEGQDGSGDSVYGRLFYGNGTRIGNEFRVNTHTSNDQYEPSVASFINGNFVVVWRSWGQDSYGSGVFGQLFYGNGTKLGNEFQVNTYGDGTEISPSVATFNNGNFVVTWQGNGQDGSGNGVYSKIFDANANMIGNEFRINTYTSQDQEFPSVATFVNGNFIVVWESEGQDSSGDGVYGRLFYGNGTNIGDEFRVNTHTSNDQYEPSVASFSNGNFVVAWRSYLQDGSGSGVYGQLFYGNGTKFGNEFLINTHIASGQYIPSVASFDNCNFVVTWTSESQDGSGNGVYGQVFDCNVNRIESEFQVNTYTSGHQSHSCTTTLNNGNFVIVWRTLSPDWGVYGRLFEGPFITSSTTSSTSEVVTSSSSSVNIMTSSSSEISSLSNSNVQTSSSSEISSLSNSNVQTSSISEISSLSNSNMQTSSISEISSSSNVPTLISSDSMSISNSISSMTNEEVTVLTSVLITSGIVVLSSAGGGVALTTVLLPIGACLLLTTVGLCLVLRNRRRGDIQDTENSLNVTGDNYVNLPKIRTDSGIQDEDPYNIVNGGEIDSNYNNIPEIEGDSNYNNLPDVDGDSSPYNNIPNVEGNSPYNNLP